MPVCLYRIAMAVMTASMLALPAGCAGRARTAKAPVFFPPAPNLPRLQYLAGISNSNDVDGGGRETFSLLSGRRPEQKQVTTIVKPSAIAAAAGKLYITDIAGQLLVVDLPKKTMEQLRGNQGAGKLIKPVGVAVDRSGFIFVADIGRKEVLIYNNNGDYLKSVGGDFGVHPTDVAVDEERIYVLDTKMSVIHVFDLVTGEFIQHIGKGGHPREWLSLPTKMSLDKQGMIRVSNAGRGDITTHDRDGNYLGSFGQFGDGLGQFSRPKGLTSDANGYIYVVDAGFQNVQIFNQEGRLLTFFGSGELPAGGMNLPCDIAISSDDLPYYQKLAEKGFELSQVVFVANQFGNPKIGLYGFGKMKGIDYENVYLLSEQRREKKARAELLRRKELGGQLTPQQDPQPKAP